MTSEVTLCLTLDQVRKFGTVKRLDLMQRRLEHTFLLNFERRVIDDFPRVFCGFQSEFVIKTEEDELTSFVLTLEDWLAVNNNRAVRDVRDIIRLQSAIENSNSHILELFPDQPNQLDINECEDVYTATAKLLIQNKRISVQDVAKMTGINSANYCIFEVIGETEVIDGNVHITRLYTPSSNDMVNHTLQNEYEKWGTPDEPIDSDESKRKLEIMQSNSA